MNREQEIEEKLKEVENLIKVTSSDELMKRSFEDFSYDNLKRNWKAHILFSIISLVVTILFFIKRKDGAHIGTGILYKRYFSWITRYCFCWICSFQASLSDRLIKSMFVKSKDKTTDSNGVSLKYTKLNESFF